MLITATTKRSCEIPQRVFPVFIIIMTIFFVSAGSALPSYAKCTKPDCKYYKAENSYNNLLKNKKLKQRRDKWLECIRQFKGVAKADPDGIWAPAGYYMTGLLYRNLYKYSNKQEDLENAIEELNKARKFTKSRYSQEASKLLRGLPKKVVKQVTRSSAPPKETVRKKKTEKKRNHKPSGGTVTIKGLRHGALPTRTRIVIDMDKPVEFKYGLLKKDPGHNKARRLYVDLKESYLSRSVRSTITLDDKRVEGIRSAYFSPETVRVAIDLKAYKDYKVFALRSPARVVVDIWGESSIDAYAESSDAPEDSSETVAGIISSSGVDLAKQLSLGVKRIVIDPGHGGEDRGAPGYFKGVYEKDIVLSIGKQLAKKIKKRLGCEVIMTRSKDVFITLEERTRIANRNKADLFISIHTNASMSRRAYGTETYFLNLAKDKASVSVAARENATSEKNISDLQTILNSLMKNTKITESSKLAKNIQTTMIKKLSRHYKNTKNKGVKQAPFYVLLGARMPAVLVETAFISNKRECKRLQNSTYQSRLCDSIVDGIERYIKEVNP